MTVSVGEAISHDLGTQVTYDDPASTYSINSTDLPSGITIIGKTLSGQAASGTQGIHNITLHYTDGDFELTKQFTITVLNRDVTVATAIPNQSITECADFTYTIPNETFSDLDNDTLS